MFWKAFGVMTPVVLGGLWMTGSLGGGGYSREVDRTPAQVMQGLVDLDVRGQPGSPGTDPAAAGGVTPLFRTERTADTITFLVMSGDQVATRMIAHLAPLDGGKRTLVTAEVQRGDAPDDFVSPAFRSNGITMGLFTMALEDELNDLVAPPQRSLAECQQLEQSLLFANAPAVSGRPGSIADAVVGTSRTVMGLHAVEAELRRQGCDTSRNTNAFDEMSQESDGGSASQPASSDWYAEASPEPDKEQKFGQPTQSAAGNNPNRN